MRGILPARSVSLTLNIIVASNEYGRGKHSARRSEWGNEEYKKDEDEMRCVPRAVCKVLSTEGRSTTKPIQRQFL